MSLNGEIKTSSEAQPITSKMRANEEIKTCLFCTKETSQGDKDCVSCHKKFHLACIPKSTLVDEGDWKCEVCTTNNKKEESNLHKSKSNKAESKASKSSTRSSILMRRLEEEKKIKEATLAKEIEIEERKIALDQMKLKRQQAIDEEFIRKKYDVIAEGSSKASSIADVHEASRRQGDIEDWIRQQSNIREEITTLNPCANVFKPLHQTIETSMPLSRSRTRQEQLASRHFIGKLPAYGGKYKEWPLFFSSYERSTELCGFTDEENALRLQESLNGKAKAAVGDMLTMPGSTKEAMTTLKSIFGRPEKILQELIEDARAMKNLREDDMQSLIEFSVMVNTICITIENGGLADHLSNPCLVTELVKKMPCMLQIFWSSHKASLPPETCLLIAFNRWLRTYFEIACDIDATNSVKSKENKLAGKNSKGFLNVHVSKSENSKPCVVCGESCTSVEACPIFKKSSTEERWKCAKDKKLCFSCLKAHIYWFCKEKRVCGIKNCDKKHHNLLHDDSIEDVKVNLVAETYVHQAEKKTLFRILPVNIHNGGKSTEVLAFIDEGSSTTLIESDILSEISAEGEISPLCLKWTGEICRTELESQTLNGLEISPINSSKKIRLHSVRSVKNLDLPAQELTKEEILKYDHTNNLPIIPYSKARPKVLLGLNNAHIGMTLRLFEGKLHEPIAAETKIGWTLYGPSTLGSAESFNAHICEGDLHNLVKESFTLDNIGIVRSEKALLPSSEKKALAMLNDFTKRVNNRFESGLLWKFQSAVLPNSLAMAKKKVGCLEKRLEKDTDLNSKMQQQMKDYEARGYIEKLSHEELEKPITKVWYLPIFPVINPNKPDKVRVVWDAAAKVKGVSLNSLLLTGPDQLSSLIGVLFRFREFSVAVCSDIEQMFHRILMRKDDQDCQRFLWRNNKSEPLDVFRMKVLTFGSCCSPSTAQFVKNKNADEYSTQFPEAAEAIKRNHYVDDYLDSFSSNDQAVRVSRDVSFIHAQAGFKIRNWLSNSKNFIVELGEGFSELSKNISSMGESSDKVLGMWWNTESDSFSYSLRLEQELLDLRRPTKREILRTLMRVFDPMGLITHVLVFAKILLKRVWRSGVEWDDPIVDDHYQMWIKWLNVLQLISSISIPRWHTTESEHPVQLHIFVDASRDAYGAAAYVRVKSFGGIRCSLLFAKSRVSPLKELSIPRLELQGAVLGVRIAKMIADEHRLRIESTHLWTDSKTVLCWVKNSELRLKQYVSFRIGEILESTNPNQWRYVPSSENVADQTTKWSSVPNLDSKSQWFQGPEFLYKSEEEWPKDIVCETSEELINIHAHCEDVSTDPILFNKFGSWNRLLRGMSIAKRFLNRLRRRPTASGALSSTELIEAEMTIYGLVQKEAFPQEISELLENGSIRTVCKSSVLRKLCPFLDNAGVLRMDSRLSDGELDYDLKYPIILPKDHYVTRLIVHYYHVRFHHLNKETVINEIRQRYSISKIRVVLNSVKAKCQICKNDRAMPLPPLMSSLPNPRIAIGTRPFTFTGVDLFGLLLVVVGRNTLKRWAMLFTCLTVRAVHIEVVHSLNTDACILGTMRFMSVRGCPRQLFSDNGTNFRGASNEIKQFMRNLDKDKIQRTFNSVTTEWIFIPPASPHMGGCWERMVKAFQLSTFNKIKPKRNPSDEMLLTMLAEACNVVNSQPLTYVPVDDKSPEAITPNHLLLGSSAGIKPMGTTIDDGDQLRKNWRYVEWFADSFWKRFRLEYLPDLCGRDKWSERVEPIKVDDIVYIVDDSTPRNEWPKGRVVEVYKGRNEQVRTCAVQTEKGLYIRPAVRLAVLQVRSKLTPEDNVPGGTVGNSGADANRE